MYCCVCTEVWSGDGELRSVETALLGRCGAPVRGWNDADELGEIVYVVGSAPRGKHVGSR
jgi:hypothetical protein